MCILLFVQKNYITFDLNLVNNINTELDKYRSANSFICKADQCSLYIGNSEDSFGILQMNVRSISKNFDHLLAILCTINITPDVIVLSECWVSKFFFVLIFF